VFLPSSKEQYLYKVRRRALVNLFWDCLITSEGGKQGKSLNWNVEHVSEPLVT